MTAKIVKEVKSQEKLTLDNLESGMKLTDSTRNPKEWKVNDDLIEQMRRYEQESNKSDIFRNKITGMFLYFKYIEDHPEFSEKKENKDILEAEIEEIEEKEVEDEENMLLDAIEDYKTENGVKSVNTNTKKFKAFFEEWKLSN